MGRQLHRPDCLCTPLRCGPQSLLCRSPLSGTFAAAEFQTGWSFLSAPLASLLPALLAIGMDYSRAY